MFTVNKKISVNSTILDYFVYAVTMVLLMVMIFFMLY
jgi:hypothetical protein